MLDLEGNVIRERSTVYILGRGHNQSRNYKMMRGVVVGFTKTYRKAHVYVEELDEVITKTPRTIIVPETPPHRRAK